MRHFDAAPSVPEPDIQARAEALAYRLEDMILGANGILPEERMAEVRASVSAALQRAREEEREACARVAEEHTEHVEFDAFQAPGGKIQQHCEPPYICSIAEAIRARGSRAQGGRGR